MFGEIKGTAALIVILFTIVSTWVMGIRMKRRARRALGRDVTAGELTSINLWMNVEDVERRENPRTEEPPLH